MRLGMREGIVKSTLAVTLSLVMALGCVGCNSSWISIAIKDVPVVLQIVTSILGIVAAAQGSSVSPQEAAVAAQLGQEATVDLQTLQSAINDYQSAPASSQAAILPKIDLALSTAQTHIQGILTALHIKDAALQATISGALGLALTTLVAIQSLVPVPPSSTRMARVPHAPPTSKALKAEYNQIVTSNGYLTAVIK